MDFKELKNRREAAGLTQAKLAEILEISLQTIKAWETNRNPINKLTSIALNAVLKEVEQEQAAKARNTERQEHIQQLARKPFPISMIEV